MDKLTHQSQIDIGTAALAGVYVISGSRIILHLGWICCKDHLNCMVLCRLEG